MGDVPHLFEYGTIPIFVTIGRLQRAPVVCDDGSVGSREVFTLRYTYDERIEDGFYAARASNGCRRCSGSRNGSPRCGEGGENIS